MIQRKSFGFLAMYAPGSGPGASSTTSHRSSGLVVSKTAHLPKADLRCGVSSGARLLIHIHQKASSRWPWLSRAYAADCKPSSVPIDSFLCFTLSSAIVDAYSISSNADQNGSGRLLDDLELDLRDARSLARKHPNRPDVLRAAELQGRHAGSGAGDAAPSALRHDLPRPG